MGHLAGNLELIEPFKAPSYYLAEWDEQFPDGYPDTWDELAAAEMKGIRST